VPPNPNCLEISMLELEEKKLVTVSVNELRKHPGR